jgi:hypothetical protein
MALLLCRQIKTKKIIRLKANFSLALSQTLNYHGLKEEEIWP